jgi:hypothetical protein
MNDYQMACEAGAVRYLEMLLEYPKMGIPAIVLEQDLSRIIENIAERFDQERECVADTVLHYFDRLPNNPYAGIGLSDEERETLEEETRKITFS